MKLFIYTVVLGALIAGCARKSIQRDDLTLFQKYSHEIECSSSSDIKTHLASAETKEPLVMVSTSTEPAHTSSIISTPDISTPVYRKKTSNRIYSKIQAAATDHYQTKNGFPFIDKENIFWKIGKGLITAGLAVVSIFGGVFISVSNYGSGAFFSSGLFIGLAIIALSIPCFLLAMLTGYMKEKSKPLEDANEI